VKQIWSPWRIDYIRGAKPADCVFCAAPCAQSLEDTLVLFRGQYSYVMMNRYPYTNGHLMVIPYSHVAELTEVPPEVQIEMLQEINMAVQALREVMNPQGFNVGLNLGASAGAGIRDHLHFHVVPRWVGDTNFMAVIGETNVIVEALESSYLQLKPVFERLCSGPNGDPFRPEPGAPPPNS
jgi:ATP adenylyltransferase